MFNSECQMPLLQTEVERQIIIKYLYHYEPTGCGLVEAGWIMNGVWGRILTYPWGLPAPQLI